MSFMLDMSERKGREGGRERGREEQGGESDIEKVNWRKRMREIGGGRRKKRNRVRERGEKANGVGRVQEGELKKG